MTPEQKELLEIGWKRTQEIGELFAERAKNPKPLLHSPIFDTYYAVIQNVDQMTQVEQIWNDKIAKSEVEPNIRKKILKIQSLFSAFHFFLSTSKDLESKYLGDSGFRRGFIHRGLIFKYEVKDDNEYNISTYFGEGLCALNDEKGWPEFRQEVIDYLDGKNDESGPYFDFWGGCGAEIPFSANILVDLYLIAPKMIFFKKDSFSQADQIIMTEDPAAVKFAITGNNKLGRVQFGEKNPNYVQDLAAGFFVLDFTKPGFQEGFSELILRLDDYQDYDITIILPYANPKYDLLLKAGLRQDNLHPDETLEMTMILTCC